MDSHQDTLDQEAHKAWKPPQYAFPSSQSDGTSKLLFTIRPQESEQPSEKATAGNDRKRKRDLETLNAREEEKIWRKAIWSPDGTHILAQSSSHSLDLFSFDSSATSDSTLQLRFSIQSPTPLLDVVWYPFARIEDPATWCFAISSRDNPVKLIDASSSKVRATYGIMDHVERFIGPQCLCFSLDGTRLYGGHSSKIYILPISTPGLNVHHLHSLPSQKGIVSSISIALDQKSGTEILAVGTFSGNTGIYSLDFGGWNEFDPDRAGTLTCLKGWKEEDGSGVSQLAFHPLNSNLLFITCRKSKHNSITLYDLNGVNEKPRFGLLAGQRSKAKSKGEEERKASVGDGAVIARFLRKGTYLDPLHRDGDQDRMASLNEREAEESQQRLFFSIDWSGRWLVAGNKVGTVNAWRIDKYASIDHQVESEGQMVMIVGNLNDEDNERSLLTRGSVALPDFSWKAQQDAITSATIHPLFSYLLTTSGARHWESSLNESRRLSREAESGSESESDSSSESDEAGDLPCRTLDSSLKLWDLN